MGERYPSLLVLDADVAHSTQSVAFQRAYPDRFYNVGISEATMVCVAAGMASEGFVPVVNTFSFLLCEHCLDQIRASVAYPGMPVKFAANYGGLSDSYDGASHHSIIDLSIMRAIPNIAVVVISDANQMRGALETILAYPGPVYFRLCRAETPVFHAENAPFAIGKVIRHAEGSDLTLIATGIPVYHAIEAARVLRAQGIRAEVLEAHTIKPLDEAAILNSARRTGAIITCEESNVLGGLGGAVAELVSERFPVPVARIGIQDRYTPSGGYDELLKLNGISVEAIVSRAIQMIAQKKSGTV